MTNTMPPEGFHDHSHTHDHVHDPAAAAVQAGAQAWLAREFVGGMIAMAQTHQIDVADFLADRCVALAMRAASGESEVEVLRTQVQVLQARIADCGCADNHEYNTGMPVFDAGSSLNTTINGAPSH